MARTRVKFKVLVVDDEQSMCFAVCKVLNKYEVDIPDLDISVTYEPVFVTNNIDYKQKMNDGTFDLVLLDYKMPDANGLELLQGLIKNKEDLLAIMMTAYATFETAVQATKLGAYDFMAKPFTPDELRYVVRKATLHIIFARKAKIAEAEKKQIKFESISILSHELKSPINAIDGYLNILLDNDSLDSDQRHHMLSRCQGRIVGMRNLIFDLLDLTRIESGQRKRIFNSCSLRNIVDEVVEGFNLESSQKHIEVFSVYQNSNDLIYCDRTEWLIIFNNLVSNAIKYNVENGTVKIEMRDDGNFLTIIVEDTGIGLTNEERERLFNDFVRIKNEDTAQISGSGLGLSTTKKLVELYDGKINVYSQRHHGTKFVVSVPGNIIYPKET